MKCEIMNIVYYSSLILTLLFSVSYLTLTAIIELKKKELNMKLKEKFIFAIIAITSIWVSAWIWKIMEYCE